MTHNLYCECGKLCGRHVEYSWGSHGQDPPEDELYGDAFIDDDGNVWCEPDCYQEAQQPQLLSDEASAVLNYDLIKGA